jgi:MoxR-like ATPase
MEKQAPVLATDKLRNLHENLTSVIRGKSECIELLVIALLAEGSVLLEDLPGVGKTTLAKALAKSLDLDFKRVQFTPDLLPGDILGSSIYNPANGTFTFQEGPLFCNVLLGDEINRASPRTQSALLEAMSERQVTVEGKTHVLSAPFLLLATQNPVEFHGTYPLPEAQLDRFLMHLQIGYPDPETEVSILFDRATFDPLDLIEPVLSRDEIVGLQRNVKEVGVESSVAQYLVAIVNQTRLDPRLKMGVSPRASLMLFRAAQAAALSVGRDYVVPDDVQRLATTVLAHRFVLTSKSKYGGISRDEIIADILHKVPVPT